MHKKYLVLVLLIISSLNSQISGKQKIDSLQMHYVQQDNKLVLAFVCFPCQGSQEFKFKNIPNQWKINQNQIIIENFLQLHGSTVRSYKFDLQIFHQQQILVKEKFVLRFQDTNILLQNLFQTQTIIVPLRSSKLHSSRILQQVKSQITQIRQVIPLTNFINNNNQNNKTSASNNVTNDQYSSPFKMQKQIAVTRQAQANKTVEDLLNLIQKVKQDYAKQSEDMKALQRQVQQQRIGTNKCGQQLYNYQDTKAKIQNALKDKKSKLNLSNLNENDAKQIQIQSNKINQYQLSKRTLQNNLKSSSDSLSSLQKLLDDCKNIQSGNPRVIQDINARIIKNQGQIMKLTNQVNETKSKLQLINPRLIKVRQNIESLQNQIRQAKQQQQSIVQQKNKYEKIINSNTNQITSLSFQIKNLMNSRTSGSSNLNRCISQQQKVRQAQNENEEFKKRIKQITSQIQNQKQKIERIKNSAENSNNPLRNQINLLNSELDKFNENINRTSKLCDQKISNYQNLAVQYNKRQSGFEQLRQKFTEVNNQLIKSQNQLNLATNNLVNVLRQQFTYLNNNQNTKGIIPIIPQINNKKQTNISLFLSPNISKLLQNDSKVKANQSKNDTNNQKISAPSVQNKIQISQSKLIFNTNLITNLNSNTKPEIPKANIQSQFSSATLSALQTAPKQTSPNTIQSQSISLKSLLQPITFNSNKIIYQNKNNIPQQTSFQQQNTNRQPNAFQQQSSFSLQQNSNLKQNPINFNSNSYLMKEKVQPSQLGDQFKLSSRQGPRQLQLSDMRSFLIKIGINLGYINLPQMKNLYSLDDNVLEKIGVSRGSTSGLFSSFNCANPTKFDSGTIQKVTQGYIIAKNSQYQYRLTLSECTKIASTQKLNSLKQGTTVFFSGTPVVSLPGNTLLNTHIIINVPQ